MMNTSTLRPGLLVSLKSSIRGNVNYIRRDIEREQKAKDGSAHAKWETERTIADVKEHELATFTRTAARAVIAKVCARSAFGLLCPDTNEKLLEEAIEESRQICAEFNANAKLTRISVYVMTGRIAADDVEAVRAINSEVRELLSDMTKGLKNLDAKAVREAANKAKEVGQMLTPDAAKRIGLAIDAARSSARQIVKAGDQMSMEIDQAAIRTIKRQANAFLDLNEAKDMIKPKRNAEAVDLSHEDKAYNEENRARGREVDKRQKKYYRPTSTVDLED